MVQTQKFNIALQAIEDELKSQGFTEIPEKMKNEVRNILAKNLIHQDWVRSGKGHSWRSKIQSKEVYGVYQDVKDIVIREMQETGRIPLFDYNEIIKV